MDEVDLTMENPDVRVPIRSVNPDVAVLRDLQFSDMYIRLAVFCLVYVLLQNVLYCSSTIIEELCRFEKQVKQNTDKFKHYILYALDIYKLARRKINTSKTRIESLMKWKLKINDLFKRALKRNPRKHDIWQEYIVFCKKRTDKPYMEQQINQMLQVLHSLCQINMFSGK